MKIPLDIVVIFNSSVEPWFPVDMMPTNPVTKKRGTRARRRVTRRGVVPVLGEMDGKKAGKNDGKRCQNRVQPSTITLEKIGFGNNWVYVWV